MMFNLGYRSIPSIYLSILICAAILLHPDNVLANANFGKSNRRAMGNPRAYPDPQESARRMILGEAASGVATPASKHSVPLTQDPLIMRLNKDEFLG